MPAPAGSVVPWHLSPPELALPAPRTDGAIIQVGTNILYIGGSDGNTAQNETYVARTVGTGNFDKWSAGPTLPEARGLFIDTRDLIRLWEGPRRVFLVVRRPRGHSVVAALPAARVHEIGLYGSRWLYSNQ